MKYSSLCKFADWPSNKAVSPLISSMFVILLSIAAITLVQMVLIPVLDRAREAGILDEGYQNMQSLQSLIKEVASEEVGSKRSTMLKVTGGAYAVNNDTGELYFYLDSKTGLYRPGSYVKRGNILTVAGLPVTATDNGTDLILENRLLRAVFNKVGNETSFATVNTSANIKHVYLKATNVGINPVDSSVYIDSTQLTGDGYSNIVRKGSQLLVGQVLFHVSSSIGTFDIIYSLKSDADFLNLNVRSLIRNKTTASLIYHIGPTSSGDYIKVGKSEFCYMC